MKNKVIRAGHTVIKKDTVNPPAVNRPPGKKSNFINSGWRSSLLIILYVDARTLQLIIIAMSGRFNQVKHEIPPSPYKCFCFLLLPTFANFKGYSSASKPKRSLFLFFIGRTVLFGGTGQGHWVDNQHYFYGDFLYDSI